MHKFFTHQSTLFYPTAVLFEDVYLLFRNMTTWLLLNEFISAIIISLHIKMFKRKKRDIDTKIKRRTEDKNWPGEA